MMAATLNVGAGNSPEATITGIAPQRSGGAPDRPRLRRPAPPVVSRRGGRALQAADARQPGAAAGEPGVSRRRAVLPRGLRLAPGGADLADASRRSIALTRDDLVAFHRAHYLPDRAVLAVAGDVSMFQARMVVESKLGGWTKPPVSATTAVAEPEPVDESKIYFVARPSSVQTNLLVGAQAIERTNRRLRRAGGDEQDHRRRPDGPAVPPSARGEGLHLRSVERPRCTAAPRRLVRLDQRPHRSDRAGAARSAGGSAAASRDPGVAIRSSPTPSDRWWRRSRCRSNRRRSC